MKDREDEPLREALKEEIETLFFEEIVLFFSVLKWTFLAAIVGIIVGTAVVIFLKILNKSLTLQEKFWYYYLFLPLGLLISEILARYLSSEARGHGTEKVIEAIHERNGKIDPKVVPVKLLATIITITFGGSVGKEGPAAQIGAGITSFLSDILRFSPDDRRKLVVCGISGGFAAVFGTPISGALFGMEVLFLGRVMYDVIVPSFVSGIVSYQTARLWGIDYEYFPLKFEFRDIRHFLTISVVSGIFFGIVAVIFIETLRILEMLFDRLNIKFSWKPLIGGAILVITTLIFSDDYLGLGLDIIHDALLGKDIPPYAFLVKIFATSITLVSGGSGGVITPIFFIGSTAGNFLGNLLNNNPQVFAALGFVGVLAGATNTPVASSIMAIEVFGPKIGPYAAVVCVVSFLITGHRSIYPSQRLGIRKSSSIEVEIGKELEEVHPVAHIRGVGFIKGLRSRLKRWPFGK
ncbi:MAG: chloride channel protein [candidate division WOR-3 bacterium]